MFYTYGMVEQLKKIHIINHWNKQIVALWCNNMFKPKQNKEEQFSDTSWHLTEFLRQLMQGDYFLILNTGFRVAVGWVKV